MERVPELWVVWVGRGQIVESWVWVCCGGGDVGSGRGGWKGWCWVGCDRGGGGGVGGSGMEVVLWWWGRTA